MTQSRQRRHNPEKPIGLWARFIAATFGNALAFLSWMLMAIALSILIEWIGMLFWWDASHAQTMLQEEIRYLGQFETNRLMAIHPAVLAQTLVGAMHDTYNWMRLPDWLSALKEHMYVLYVAISSAVNITYMMCIRVVTILFTLPVFILWFIVAATDGLTQRDIRKYEGGIESSFVYHKVKPFILPAIALSCGIYLTSPFSINPALFFLLPQLILFFATYWTCATFKKFL